MRNVSQPPSSVEEELLEAQGYQLIAGIDEVGRGSLAGPVVAAAVILPGHIDTSWLNQVKDSKQLPPARRESLFHHIREVAVSIGIGVVPPQVIDTRGIVKATRLAMKLAVDDLSLAPEFLLIDYLRLPEVPLPQKGITNGDCRCFSIACASIMAKVSRDDMMREFNGTYPGYGLAQHKGYGTKGHLACLRRLGPSLIHRQSFQPVRDLIQQDK